MATPGTGMVARAGLVASAAAVVFTVLLLPVKLCLVAALLHVPCPGCGLTRAAFAMARGDFSSAFALHPLSLVLVPLIGWTLTAHALRYVRTGRAWTDARLGRRSEALVAAFAVLLVGVWIARLCGYLGGPVAI